MGTTLKTNRGAQLVSAFDRTPIEGAPWLAERSHFDARANRALCGTATGESMAGWGERYMREARAVLAMSSTPGTLWERVAESAAAVSA